MSQRISIFGSNGAALISALYFEKQGAQVTLFDPGQHFEIESPRFFSPEVPFWLSTESNFESLAWLEALIDRPLGGVEIDSPPLTFDGTEPKAFIGFGEKKYTSIPAISTFNIRARLQLNCTSETIYQRARECFNGNIQTYSEISAINFGADGIESVQINGAKDVTSDLYVFCLPPTQLLELIPTDILPNKVRTKMARTQAYAKITLESKTLATEAMQTADADLSGSYIFLLPPQNDHQPCIGTFSAERSVWHSFCPIEELEDPEGLANQVRQMRKLIEKSLPLLAEPIRAGSISVQPDGFAEYDSEEIHNAFKKSCKNATLASPNLSSAHGLTGCVDSARTAIAHIDASHNITADQASEDTPSMLESQT